LAEGRGQKAENRDAAIVNRKTANVKREKVREDVTFLTIFISHYFHLSPLYQLCQPYQRYQLLPLFT
jgi:hypothetical protein